MIAAEQYPALPEFHPKPYSVYVCIWMDHSKAWKWTRVGVADDEAGAKELIRADLRAMDNSYGGLISTKRGPRVYRTYCRTGIVQIGEDEIR